MAWPIRNVNSGLVLDVPGFSTDDGAPIQQHTWNGGSNQMWDLLPVSVSASISPYGSGFFKIRSQATGKLLTAPTQQPQPAQVVQQADQDLPNQVWYLLLQNMDNSGGQYRFSIINIDSGLVLDVPGFSTDGGTLIQEFSFNGGTNQLWYLG